MLKFKGLDYVLDIVKDEYIFLNSPINFNDPLDSYFITMINENGFEERTLLKDYT